MIYYELQPAAADHHGPFGLLNNSIVDRTGLKICSSERGVRPNEIAPGVDVRTVKQSYLAVGSQKRLADLLTYSFERALILRESVLHEFEAAGIRLAPDIADFVNLSDLSSAEGAALRGGLAALSKLGVHVSVPTLHIPVPATLVKKLQKKVGPLWGTPPMQGLLGAAFGALVTELRGFDTTDLSAAYTGFDAVMKSSSGIYAVVEAKGGSSTLAMTANGKQMYDKWIRSRISKIVSENPGSPDAGPLLKLRNSGPLLAMIVATELTGGSPEIAVKVQTYPGIKSWGRPFE